MPAEADVFATLAALFDRHGYESFDGWVVFVGDMSDDAGVAVEAKSKLSEVVATD